MKNENQNKINIKKTKSKENKKTRRKITNQKMKKKFKILNKIKEDKQKSVRVHVNPMMCTRLFKKKQ